MMIKLNLKKRFRKRLQKLDSKLQLKTKSVLKMFVREPYAVELRRHRLKGSLEGYETLDVTGDLRILIQPQTGEVVDVVDVGNHGYFYD